MNPNQKHARVKKSIKQIVVVEGKTDTQKLQKLFDVKTIETNGSAVSEQTINLIKLAAKKSGVILFLDPDYQGNKIRKLIASHLDEYQECYIYAKNMKSGSKKIGIAEATDEAIITALNEHVINKKINSTPSIQWDEYLTLNLDSKSKRLELCEALKINYCNHKQLFKQLNLIGLTYQDVLKIINDEK